MTPLAPIMTQLAISTPGLPLVNQALEPASVRNGSPAVQKAYTSALAFEEMLVQQLSQALTHGTGLGDSEEGSEESSAGTSEGSSASAPALGGGGAVNGQLASLLPQALTEGVMRQGGLGLATQLMGSLDPGATHTAAGAGVVGASGGTPAVSGVGGGTPSAATRAPSDALAGAGNVTPTGGVSA